MEDNGIIYHYCRMESFFNIIKGKSIWLSDALKTNDFLELKWILEVLNFPNISTDLESFKLEYEYWVRTFYRPHIACFSTEGDVLSQWRGYANDGKGVAIGFNRNYFESISNPENKETKLIDVVYDEVEQRQKLGKLMKSIDIEQFHKINSNLEGLSSIVLIQQIIEYGLFFKHYSFREEKEIRLIHGFGEVSAESESIKYRSTEDNLISYMEIPLNIENEFPPIREIVLGPKNKADERDVKNFYQRIFGIQREIKITRSMSSYR